MDARRVGLVAFIFVVLLAPLAQANDLKRGRMSFGLSGGFGNRSVTIGGSFGYFVATGLVPILSQSYSWAGGDSVDSHQLRTDLELRYYVIDTSTVAPFVFGDIGHVFLAFRGSGVDEDHNLGTAGGGGGLLIRLGGVVGLELGVRVGAWFGAPDSLYDRGFIDEGAIVSGRFGLSFIL